MLLGLALMEQSWDSSSPFWAILPLWGGQDLSGTLLAPGKPRDGCSRAQGEAASQCFGGGDSSLFQTLSCP